MTIRLDYKLKKIQQASKIWITYMQNKDKQTVASARYVCYGIFIGMQNETQKKIQ